MTQPSHDLLEQVASSIKKISTQALDLSFNELLDMHLNAEIDISPDYQRLFRWTDAQQSRFLESLILGMPVPPIFVLENTEGKYELIDGLQRISSYLHFRGRLSAEHLDPPVKEGDHLALTDCDIVKELNGLTFENLPIALQIRLKRAFIRVEVIGKGTDANFRYHMFKRLNTGGENLSEQQIRNCSIRLLGATLPNYIIKLSEYEPFKDCTRSLTQERRLSAFDQELVLRFFAFKNRRERFKHEVSDFLTDYMEDVASNAAGFSYEDEERIFQKTFTLLSRALNEYAFAFANRKKRELSAGFSIYHYEAITVGMQSVLHRIDPENTAHVTKLEATLREIKLHEDFIGLTTGGGKNSPGPLNLRIGFVEGRLLHAFN